MKDQATSNVFSRSELLLTQLENYEPINDREITSIILVKELLANSSNDDVFNQEKSRHHITGSAFVLSHNRLLLHFHKKIGKWLQPGGHLDPGESARDAAIRETMEETGVVADFNNDIFHVDVHETPSGHVHYDIRYIAFCQSSMLRPGHGESQKVAWFTSAAMSTLTDPALTGAFEKLVRTGKFLAQ